MSTINPPSYQTHRTDSTRCGPGATHGFTLTELIATLAVMAILAAMAAPSFTKTVAGTQGRAAATDLLFALIKTRSEAVKRNTPVTLSAKSGGWQNGWSIPDPDDSSNPALDDHGALPPRVSLSSAVTSVIYYGSGRIATSGTVSFSISASDSHWCVSIDPSGRPYTKESPC